MSLIIVSLEGAPKVDVDATKKEEELDVMLRSSVQGLKKSVQANTITNLTN